MKSHTASEQSKSIKTFFIYSAIVLFFILVSLLVKSYFIIQHNKFDSKHQFVLAVAQKGRAKEIVVFHPANHSVTLVKLTGKSVGLSSLGKTLGVIPDGWVDTEKNLPFGENIAQTIKAYAFTYQSQKTDLTIFDFASLIFASQKTAINTETVKELSVFQNSVANDKLVSDLFTDDALFSENVSIQIINSSGTTGMGKRLETVLTNLGANVIAVSTSRGEEKASKIQYFGHGTYTLTKLKKLLEFPVEKIEKEAIANIVITIGEDQVSTPNF
jgi:hypothetical protein